MSIKAYARVQQFPGDWAFQGSVSDKHRQVGNAVPVGFGYATGTELKRFLVNFDCWRGWPDATCL